MLRVVPAPRQGHPCGGLNALYEAYGPSRSYRRGRGALAAALGVLGLRAGDEVVVPSFLCPEALIPFGRAALGVAFYATDEGLMPDWDDLARSLAPRTKAMLLYHPFGQPAPSERAAQFCRRNGLMLIEDCAHALGTRAGARLAGTWGEAGIFSLRKFAPSLDGGLLVLRDASRLPPEGLPAAPSWGAVLKSCLRRAGERGALPELLEEPLRRRERRAFEEPLPIPYADDGENDDAAPGRWAVRALDAFDFKIEREARRERFRLWLAALMALPGAKPLYRDLVDGASPYSCPVFFDDRPTAHRALLQSGIAAEPTLNYPALDYPFLRRRDADYAKDERLARGVLSLPVHSRVPPQAIFMAGEALRGMA